MDEMKQSDAIENALREVARHRDKLLRAAPTLSPEREAILTDCVARKFPLETALRGAATKRDQLLPLHRSGIPESVESILHRRLDALHAAGSARFAWLTFLRSPSGISLAACAVIVAAILCFGSGRTPSFRQAVVPTTPRLDALSTDSGTALFSRRIAIRPFNLNTNEPASLQASLVANSGIDFADGIEAPLGLRLDLPVRAILTEDTLARTP